MASPQLVLVAERNEHINAARGFVPLDGASGAAFVSEKVAPGWGFVPREKAEKSNDWVQMIPCAGVLDDEGRLCVSRRIKEGREDIGGRLTLLYGGHADADETGSVGSDEVDFLRTHLWRELEEEMGVGKADAENGEAKLIGVISDPSTPESRRHFAVVFRVIVPSGEVTVQADEEFSRESKYRGAFVDASEIGEMVRSGVERLDPWSSMLFAKYVADEGE